MVTEATLTAYPEAGILPPRTEWICRAPGSEFRPNLKHGEAVLFTEFLDRGLSLPCSPSSSIYSISTSSNPTT